MLDYKHQAMEDKEREKVRKNDNDVHKSNAGEKIDVKPTIKN